MTGHTERTIGRLQLCAAIVLATGMVVSAIYVTGARSASATPPETQQAVQLQRAFNRAVENVQDAVVNIQVESVQRGTVGGFEPFDDFFHFFFPFGRPAPRRVISQGSGFLIDRKGHILTNDHVVAGAEKIKVVFRDKSTSPAQIVGEDARLDVAVIRVKKSVKFAPAKLGDSDAIRVGDWAIAVGNPFGLDHTVTVGVISAKGRELDVVGGRRSFQDYIQTDASINPGNSGGPLLNIFGEVIGVNNAIYSTSGGNIGIGFAIPINNIKPVLQQLIEKGHVVRGWLGVTIQELTPELAKGLKLQGQKGVLVSDVFKNSPAEKAGMESGDLIVSYDGKKVESVRTLQRLVAQTPPGKKVEVEVLRNGQRKKLVVTIEPMPGDEEIAQMQRGVWRGMRLQTLPPRDAKDMGLGNRSVVIVAAVATDSPAHDAGVRRGDVILRVGNTAVHSVQQFMEAVRGYGKNETVPLLLWRDGRKWFVTIAGQQ